MLKIIFLIMLLSTASFAQLIEFTPQEPVKAQEVNNNFLLIKNTLSSKNADISFHNYNSGELIDKDQINAEFAKIRDLGIIVDLISNNKITAEELNNLFYQALNGAISYDDPPIANNMSISVNEDTLIAGSFNFMNVVGTNSVQIVSQPTNGVLTVTGTNFTYQGNLNYFGSDTFQYLINDGNNNSNVATVNITILSVNDAPIISNSAITLNEDSLSNFSLSHTDIENDIVSFNIQTSPTKGVLTGSYPNFTYTPNPNVNGSDSFSYKLNDGQTDSNLATVSITIVPINDAPSLAGNTSIAVTQNVAFNGSLITTDIDSSSFSYIITQNPTKGSVVFQANGNYVYTPSLNSFGSDSFSVKSNDGSLDSNILTISVQINGSGLVLNNGAINYFDGTYASSCNNYKVTNSGNYSYSGATGDGLYRISVSSGGTQVVYCDMSTDSGGWTLIASGGTLCGNFNQKSSTSAVYPTHATYTSNCGYLSEPVVRSIANQSTSVRLRAGANATSSYTQVSSTGSNPILSLRNTTNWHTYSAYAQFTAGFSWTVSGCPSTATYWPFMYHACGNTAGVHWTSGNHIHHYNSPPAMSSTWVK